MLLVRYYISSLKHISFYRWGGPGNPEKQGTYVFFLSFSVFIFETAPTGFPFAFAKLGTLINVRVETPVVRGELTYTLSYLLVFFAFLRRNYTSFYVFGKTPMGTQRANYVAHPTYRYDTYATNKKSTPHRSIITTSSDRIGRTFYGCFSVLFLGM